LKQLVASALRNAAAFHVVVTGSHEPLDPWAGNDEGSELAGSTGMLGSCGLANTGGRVLSWDTMAFQASLSRQSSSIRMRSDTTV
jgi:hypothetical protein